MAAAWSATAHGTASSPSSTLATNSTGLPVSGERLRIASGASWGTGTVRAGVPACSASITWRSQASSATAALSPERASRMTCAWRRSAVSRSASSSSVSIVSMSARRIHAPSGWMTLSSVWRADDVQQRVALADVGQELVAQALALGRAGHEAGDVVELDRVPDDVGGPDRLGDLLHPLVLDRHDGDVGLDRRERVVRGLGARLADSALNSEDLPALGIPTSPTFIIGPRLPISGAERRAGGDVGRVVDAEVEAAERHRGGGDLQRRARHERAERARGGERRGRVARREGESGGCGHQVREVLDRRALAADGELDRRGRGVGRADRRGRAQPAAAAPAVDERRRAAGAEPDRAVLAEVRVAAHPARPSPACAPASRTRR